jgi:hypothetical protein
MPFVLKTIQGNVKGKFQMIALSHSTGMTSIAALLLINVNRHDSVFLK